MFSQRSHLQSWHSSFIALFLGQAIHRCHSALGKNLRCLQCKKKAKMKDPVSGTNGSFQYFERLHKNPHKIGSKGGHSRTLLFNY